MNNDYNKLDTSIQSYTQNITDYIAPLKSFLSSYISDDNIYQIINCSFLSEELQYIYIHINEQLAPSSIKIGSVIVSLAFINSVNVIFLLIVIFKNIKPRTSRLKRQAIFHQIREEVEKQENEIQYNEISPHDNSGRNNQMEMSHLNLNHQ